MGMASLARKRSLVQIKYGPPVWRENSNASNSPRGPFRGPSGPGRAKRSLSSPRLIHWYGSLLSRCCPGNDNEIRRSARYNRGAARRLTISRTWLADRSPPCRVQNSRWRPLTPSQGRSASQSCTTGDSTVVWPTVPARSPSPCRTRTASRGLGDVGGLEVQRLLDAKTSPVEDGQQLADLGVGEDLGGGATASRGLPEAPPVSLILLIDTA